MQKASEASEASEAASKEANDLSLFAAFAQLDAASGEAQGLQAPPKEGSGGPHHPTPKPIVLKPQTPR